MQRKYHLDTNVLMEDEKAIENLRNGEENEIYIPITVIDELDRLSKVNEKRPKAKAAIQDILNNKEHINFTGNIRELICNDDIILSTLCDPKYKEDTLVTNDTILQLKAYINGINAEGYRSSIPFRSESQKYTGFIDWYKSEEYINNCFYFKDGKLFHYTGGKEFYVDKKKVWNVVPRDVYQIAAIELLLNDDIKVVTIQGAAGSGKTFISIASAIKKVLENKSYGRVVGMKYPIEIGQNLGFLPGPVEEKMSPYWNSMYKLLLKLHEIRSANKLFLNPDVILPDVNPRKFEFLPVSFLRGENVEDAFVVISESQNISRHDMRTILTRLGENTKVVIEGDVTQIDNPQCNTDNNGLNWVVKKFKGYKQYGHITIQSKNSSRGVICDMVLDSGL